MRRSKYAGLWRLLPLWTSALLSGCSFTVLDPKGQIGADERSIIVTATGLMLIVVVPVIILTLAFAWRYRASNRDSVYAPDWAHSTRIEAVVWAVPCAIVAALAVLAWTSSHKLDPYRPIASTAKPITIEVVSLDWKWLFIYPGLHMATVNQIAFPVNVPVNFHITSGSVMNSFFIPQLGGQVYAMAGMQTQLHLIADAAGSYDGISGNYSGAGFSGMTFKALAMNQGDFRNWMAKVRGSSKTLGIQAYEKLKDPSENAPVAYFSSVDRHLFHDILDNCLFAGSGSSCMTPVAKD
jgi:cytochrome o ubiquinol oxidase subunit II